MPVSRQFQYVLFVRPINIEYRKGVEISHVDDILRLSLPGWTEIFAVFNDLTTDMLLIEVCKRTLSG